MVVSDVDRDLYQIAFRLTLPMQVKWIVGGAH